MCARPDLQRLLIGVCLASILFLSPCDRSVAVEGAGPPHPSERLGPGGAVPEAPSPVEVPVGPAPEVDPDARSAGANESWLKSVRVQVERDEYSASVNDRGLQAPNRAHNLRTYFRDEGIEIVPRIDGGGDAWSFTWRTTGWGRGKRCAESGAGFVAPSPDGPRVRYQRAGLEEWYENKGEGLEQGFTLAVRPGGEGPLRIEGALGGSLRPQFRTKGPAIDLLNASGAAVLRYAGLRVHDASGREIPSRLKLLGSKVLFLVEDLNAPYPLTIDPIVTSPSWIAEGNQGSALFGCSVGTAGDVNGDGYSDVIVGAYGFDNGEADEGRVYVYHGSPDGLSATPAWTAESNQAGAQFGISVGTAGDVNGDGYSDVIIGANLYDNVQVNEGRAYVYHGSPDGLSATPAWSAESDQGASEFGISVGTAGDVNGDGYSDVIVGAYHYDNGETDEGRAYVYHGSPNGLLASPSWTAEGNQASAYFGVSVGTAGDVNGDGCCDVIVGAYFYDYSLTDEGRAFVYHGSPSGLAASANWAAGCGQSGARFGYSVGTAGDVNGDSYSDVIVGAFLYNDYQGHRGRAFVYHGSPGGLAASPAWTADDRGYFGYSVGTAGDVDPDGYSDVIVGARNYTNNQEGRVFVYQGSSSGLAASPVWFMAGDQNGAMFGYSVGTAGDVNGDGCSDVIIGAPYYDNGQADEGRAYVYQGLPPQGACCDLGTGVCEIRGQHSCLDAGGEWHGDWTTCEPNPCPQPIPNAQLTLGTWSDPEPWHDWIASMPGSQVEITLNPGEVTDQIQSVEFFLSSDLGVTWQSVGIDEDGTEPRLNTYDDTVQLRGDGWSVIAPVPQLPADWPLKFKALVHTTTRGEWVVKGESSTDPAPPSLGTTNMKDWYVTDSDALGIEVQSNGTEISEIVIYRGRKLDDFVKGIPGIDQHAIGDAYCAPTAVAQCLKYFEEQGDSSIVGELEPPALIEQLGNCMYTNPSSGTYVSNWKGGIGSWIGQHGSGYTVRGYRHYTRDGELTWDENDWRLMRNELERCQDVLLGVFWYGIHGGHALTLNSIRNSRLPNGRILLGFKDPWNGNISNGELDPTTGVLYNVTGAGYGHSAYIGVTMLVSPKEPAVNEGGPGEAVYDDLPVGGPPYVINVALPDPGVYFLHVVIVNALGHANRLSYVVVRRNLSGGPDLQEAMPMAFALEPGAPNPFRDWTEITYAVPRSVALDLAIYDLTGRKVRTLVDGEVAAGFHKVVWEGTDGRSRRASPGIYYVRMQADDWRHTRSITLLK